MNKEKNYSRAFAGGVLFIGLGGTGTEVVKRLKFLLDETPDGKTKPYKFYIIDSDNRGKEEIYRLGIPYTFIGNFSPEIVVSNNFERIKSWWWPKSESSWLSLLPRVEDGAGEIRLMGRLGFYLNLIGISNLLHSQIDDLKSFLGQLKKNSPNTDTRVDTFIIGSFAGGTGSSIYNDIAAVIHKILKDTGEPEPQVTGIFLTGDAFLGKINEEALKERVKANTFASLAEYFYDKAALSQKLRPRLNPLANNPNLPSNDDFINSKNYTNLILIQDINEHGAIADVDDLYDFVAYSMYTIATDYGRIVSENKNVSAVFTAVNLGLPDVLSSMGAYSIYYPKKAVQDYATKSLLAEILPLYFYNNNKNAHEADEKNVGNEADNLLEKLYLTPREIVKGLNEVLRKNTKSIMDHVNFSNEFLMLRKSGLSAMEIYNKITSSGQKKIEMYSKQLQSIFESKIDELGNKKPTIIDEKLNFIKNYIKQTYLSKDFGYLDSFLQSLSHKLEAIENSLIEKRGLIGKQTASEKNLSKQVKLVLDRYNRQLFGSVKQMNYLKKIGISNLESYYEYELSRIGYDYANKLINSIKNEVNRELNGLNSFESAMKELTSSISLDLANFSVRFDETEKIKATKSSVLTAKEIKTLVENSTPDAKQLQDIYKALSEKVYEPFRKKWLDSHASSNNSNSINDSLKVDVKNKFLEEADKIFEGVFSHLLDLSMYDSLKAIYHDDEEVKDYLKERILILSHVTPFINTVVGIRNVKAISFKGYMSLPADKSGNIIDQRWVEISKPLVERLNAKLSGKIQQIPSPNDQFITLSIIDGGIRPESLTYWNSYVSAYKDAIGDLEGSFERDVTRIPVTADYQVEREMDKVFQIMINGGGTETQLRHILEIMAIGYVLGNIVEEDNLNCYIRLSYKLEDSYWDKYITEFIDSGGKKYYKFTPPNGNGEDLYKLFKYLVGLSTNSSIIQKLTLINQSMMTKNPLEFKEEIKSTIKKLNTKIENSSMGGRKELVNIYRKIKDILENYLFYS